RPRDHGRRAPGGPAGAPGGRPFDRGLHWLLATPLAAHTAVPSPRLAGRRPPPRPHRATLAPGRAALARPASAAPSCTPAPPSVLAAPVACLGRRFAGAPGASPALARRDPVRPSRLAASPPSLDALLASIPASVAVPS